jgi:cytidine deaminase
MEFDRERLVRAAMEAALKSYSPYSGFRVGAALLTEDGTILTGTNVENRSYGLTMCAERSAVSAAVSSGYRRFLAIAVASPDSDGPLPPCGACRQVISEFSDPGLAVIMAGKNGRFEKTIAELFPDDSLHELKNRSR